MRSSPHILIVDNKPENLEVLALACSNLDFGVEAVEDPVEALRLFKAGPFAVVLTSHEMSPMNGIDLIKEINAIDQRVHAIIMADQTDTPLVEFLNEADSVTLMLRPFRHSELVEQVRVAAHKHFGATALLNTVAMTNKMDQCLPLLGCSREVCDARKLITQLAPSSDPIFVDGPAGVGKPDVVKFIHYSGSFSESQIVLCRCDEMTREMIEAELISPEGTWGSSVEAAKNGTLCIQNVESIPLDLQAVLARQFGELAQNCRVVSCADSTMDALLESGQVDAALYFQLTLHVIHLPALAARPVDIEEITRFVAADPERYGLARSMERVEVDLLVAELRRSELHGNLRELIQRVKAATEAEPLVV